MFIDTHCHLQDTRIINRIDEVIQRAKDSGVTAMVCCGCCEDDWDAVVKLSRQYDCIIPALGIHPWWARGRSTMWEDRLVAYLEHYPDMMVGEIGLDHAVDGCDAADQMTLFTRQMNIAYSYNRPVSIHCRKAWGDLTAFFREQPKAGALAVIHSYSGSVEMIDELIKYKVMFSLSGSVTNPNNRRGRKNAVAVPAESLLLETDSPDSMLSGKTGDNEPANLAAVAEAVALLRGMNVADLAAITTANAYERFRLHTRAAI